MSAAEADAAERNWWVPHLLATLFVALVAAILGAVPGWSAALHVWIALSAAMVGALAVHASVLCGAWARRGRWRRAAAALLLAAGLCGAAAALVNCGRLHLGGDDGMSPYEPDAVEPMR